MCVAVRASVELRDDEPNLQDRGQEYPSQQHSVCDIRREQRVHLHYRSHARFGGVSRAVAFGPGERESEVCDYGESWLL